MRPICSLSFRQKLQKWSCAAPPAYAATRLADSSGRGRSKRGHAGYWYWLVTGAVHALSGGELLSSSTIYPIVSDGNVNGGHVYE
jgi:hypothetical protein